MTREFAVLNVMKCQEDTLGEICVECSSSSPFTFICSRETGRKILITV